MLSPCTNDHKSTTCIICISNSFKSVTRCDDFITGHKELDLDFLMVFIFFFFFIYFFIFFFFLHPKDPFITR